MALFMQYDWPGNVRELENIIERAAILTDTDILLPDVLPPNLANRPGNVPVDGLPDSFSLKKIRKVVERNLIVKALNETGGNRTRAAKLLEISHPSLLSKMKMYEIDM
jgi:two-component system response regulator AtoC